MKILIVEDDGEFLTALVEIITECKNNIEIKVAQCRDDAIELIKNCFFDLVLLDLKIPTTNQVSDENPAHGHAVFSHIRLQVPGTPIIVLTGSSGEEYIPTLLAHSEKSDIWGGLSLQLVSFHRKHLLDTFPDVLKKYVNDFYVSRDIELKKINVKLTEQEDRLIRIFCRKFAAARCTVAKIGGGLSKSKVFRLSLTNPSGVSIHDVICKISDHHTITDEGGRYNKYVSRLPPDATPRKLSVIEFGGGNICGVFYGLAEGFNRTAFEMINSINPDPNLFIENLRNLVIKWSSIVEVPTKVSDIRGKFLSDENFNILKEKLELSWLNEFENNHVQARQACAHFDLHGLNVLVSDAGVPILIDYGDIYDGPTSVDPITLELSLFFHPDGPLRKSVWPDHETAENWGDLEKYLKDCPCPEFIRSCRKWTNDSAAGEREIAAIAYSYLIRQIKYETADINRTKSFLIGIKKFYDQT